MVDAANVVGARPDGWWRDRAGAAERLLTALASAVAADGVLAGRPVSVVLEGAARRAAPDGVAGLDLVRAERDGDSAIVDLVAALVRGGVGAVVVTSDRALREQVTALGAGVRGAGWLRDLLDGRSR